MKGIHTINHQILFSNLQHPELPPSIRMWTINFISHRLQAVVSGGAISYVISVHQSNVQGSSFGPVLYVIYASDLRPNSAINKIIQYAEFVADYTTLLVAQRSPVPVNFLIFSPGL